MVMQAHKKNQIVNSYSRALMEILLKDKDCAGKINELQDAVCALKEINKLEINPLIINDYNKAIEKISLNLDAHNDIQQFLLNIFRRRYGFLLEDVLQNIKEKMQTILNKKQILIMTYNTLSSERCKEVENIIQKQIGDAEFTYKINKNISKDGIDIISNGNICSIDLSRLTKKFLVV